MKPFGNTRSIVSGMLLLATILLAACETGMNASINLPIADGGKGCTKVGILLPETTSSDRWETKDHPLLVQAVNAAIPGVQIDYTNARDSAAI